MLIDLFDNNYILIFLILFVVLCLIVFLIVILKHNRKKIFLNERKKANNELIECLGGFLNIISASSVGSRLSLVLNDYKIINEEKLKQLGVSSIIKMSNKLTLVIGEEAKDIALLITSNNDKIH